MQPSQYLPGSGILDTDSTEISRAKFPRAVIQFFLFLYEHQLSRLPYSIERLPNEAAVKKFKAFIDLTEH